MGMPLLHALRLNARRLPHRPALRFREQTWSYAELLSRAERAAAALAALSIAPGEKVPMLSFNHPDMLVAYFALTGIGAIPAPLNYRLADDDLRHGIAAAHARFVLLGSGFAPASMTDATVMLIVLVAFALLSLALNRRALIVSGLVTFATSLWFLVNELGGGGVNTLMLTALIIGGAIVLLGGGWRTARRVILKVFPQEGTLGRIFPPEPA